MTTFRPIEGRDREAIRRLIEGTGAFKPSEAEVAMELVDAGLGPPTGEDDYQPYVLEEEDGTIVAYACFGKTPMTTATFDLYWVATRADRMGKGYGREILARVEEEVGRQGGRLLVIETSSQESYGGTREFYRKTGCTLTAQIPDFYDKGDDKLIYTKTIG